MGAQVSERAGSEDGAVIHSRAIGTDIRDGPTHATRHTSNVYMTQ